MRDHTRRNFLRQAVAAAAATVVPAMARAAAAHPNRPVKILIDTPPGDTADGWTRSLADVMARVVGASPS